MLKYLKLIEKRKKRITKILTEAEIIFHFAGVNKRK